MKKMKLILSIFLSFLFYYCNAQEKFKPGIIILNNNDTINCGINPKNSNSTPDKIEAKINNKILEYYTADLKGFEIDKEDVYKRFNVSYHLDASEITGAKNYFSNKIQTKQTWLKYLYISKFSLLKLNTNNRTYFFVQTTNTDSIVELIYKIKIVEGELIKDEQYKNQLIAITSNIGNIKMQESLSGLSYTEQDLIAFFKSINNDKGVGYNLKTKVEICAIGGISYNTLTTGGSPILTSLSGTIGLNVATFKSTIGYKAGVLFNNLSGKRNNTIQPFAGVALSSLKIEGENNNSYYTYKQEKYSGTLFLAEPFFAVNYVINKYSKTPVSVGPIIGYNISLNKQITKVRLSNPSFTDIEITGLPAISQFLSIGFNCNVAITKTSKLLVQYSYFGNLTNSSSSSLIGHSYSLDYIYVFNKIR